MIFNQFKKQACHMVAIKPAILKEFTYIQENCLVVEKDFLSVGTLKTAKLGVHSKKSDLYQNVF
jgi:hypothetical protein